MRAKGEVVRVLGCGAKGEVVRVLGCEGVRCEG